MKLRQQVKELRNRIALIPYPDEWWVKSGLSTFNKIGKFLLQKGFTVDEAFDLLETCYFAVGNPERKASLQVERIANAKEQINNPYYKRIFTADEFLVDVEAAQDAHRVHNIATYEDKKCK